MERWSVATPAVHYHVDRTEIDFVKDGDWKAVSLTPYLTYSDSVAVVVEAWNNHLTDIALVRFDNNADVVEGAYLYPEGIIHYALRLDGVNKEVQLNAEGVGEVHVAIIAELRGPGVVVHDPVVLLEPSGPGDILKWTNRSVTLEGGDSASDVEAVLILACTNADWTSDWGARALGSTTERLWGHTQYQQLYWLPSATDDGDFQIWFPGKTSPQYQCFLWMWELGYVKKGYHLHGIVDFEDEEPAKATVWTERTAGPTVADGAGGMFAVTYSLGLGPKYHGLRTIGSSDDAGKPIVVKPFDSADAVRLDPTKQYEYMAACNLPEIWPLAYTMTVEPSGAATVVAGAQADPHVRTFASGDWIVSALSDAAAISAAMASGTEVTALSLSGEAILPTTLSALPALESTLSAGPELEDALSAVPEILATLTATPDAGPIFSGDPDIRDILSGKPAIPEG